MLPLGMTTLSKPVHPSKVRSAMEVRPGGKPTLSQLMALSAGRDGVIECDETLQDKVAGQGGMTSHSSGMSMLTEKLVWPALLRKLDREYPGYDA